MSLPVRKAQGFGSSNGNQGLDQGQLYRFLITSQDHELRQKQERKETLISVLAFLHFLVGMLL